MIFNKDVDKKIERNARVIDSKLKDSFGAIKKDMAEIKDASRENKDFIVSLEEKLSEIKQEICKGKDVVADSSKELELQKQVEFFKFQIEKEKEKQELNLLIEKQKSELELQKEKLKQEVQKERVKSDSKIFNFQRRLRERVELRSVKKAYEKQLNEISKKYQENQRELIKQAEKSDSLIKSIENQRKKDFDKFMREKDSLVEIYELKLKSLEENNKSFQESLVLKIEVMTKKFSDIIKESNKNFERTLVRLDKKRQEDNLIILKQLALRGGGEVKKVKEVKVEDNLFDKIKGKFEGNIYFKPEIKAEKILKILAFVIPVFILLFFLYINFLPFGYDKEYVLTIDDNGTVHSSSSAVYFEDIKGNKITNVSDIYSLGGINLIVKPWVILKNVNVSASINGEDVYFAQTDFNVNEQSWDYFWDFSERVPADLKGTAKYDSDKACVYFNGSNNETLSYPNSSDMFENDSFIVYAEWMPENIEGKNQQIIGHYNWELFQSATSVRFMVGRLENKTGAMPSISYPVNESFFNEKHSALAIYSADKENGKGYIDFWVDGNFAGRKTISNETIWEDYNKEKDLTLGWSPHNYGNNPYYAGCIYFAGFDYGKINYPNKINFLNKESSLSLSLIGTEKLNSVEINLRK